MKPLSTMARTELTLLLREPAALFFVLALPLLLLGLNSGGVVLPGTGGLRVADIMLPSLVVMVMLTTGLMALPEALASQREKGILRRLRVSPFRAWQVAGGHIGAHAGVSVVGLVLLVGVGVGALGVQGPQAVGPVVVAVAAAMAGVLGLGFMIGALAPTTRTAQAVAALLYFPSLFASGAAYPREALPEFARRVGDVLPLTPAVRVVREAWTYGTVDWAAVGILIALAGVCAAVAATRFRWAAVR